MEHSLRRTSPKGGPFAGFCVLCGKDFKSLQEAAETPCTSPAAGTDAALVGALWGDH